MKRGYILSSDLPKMGDTVKQCVNNGVWFLYKGTAAIPAYLYIEVDRDVYALDEQGGVIAEFDIKEPIDRTERVYFSDLPRPPPLSDPYASKCCGRE